jgi:anti-sigma B factor antagonist
MTPDDAVTIVITEGQVTVVGEVDIASAPSVVQAVTRVADDSPTVVLDLGAITFIDSSGLHALTRLCQHLPGLRIVNPSANVRRLIEIAGLTEEIFGHTENSTSVSDAS